jgi:hypothetical protein
MGGGGIVDMTVSLVKTMGGRVISSPNAIVVFAPMYDTALKSVKYTKYLGVDRL